MRYTKEVTQHSGLTPVFKLQWRHMNGAASKIFGKLDCLYDSQFRLISKKSSTFRIVRPLCGESTGDRWIPPRKDQCYKTKFVHIITWPWVCVRFYAYKEWWQTYMCSHLSSRYFSTFKGSICNDDLRQNINRPSFFINNDNPCVMAWVSHSKDCTLIINNIQK